MPDDDTAPEPPRGPNQLVFWIAILLLAALVVLGAVLLGPQIGSVNPGMPNLNL